MAIKTANPNSTVPVIVADKTDSYKPVQKDGFLLADSRVTNVKPGTVMLYNYATQQYSKIDYVNSTLDYIQKTVDYKNIYDKIQQSSKVPSTIANPLDNTQVNSFADVLARNNPFKGFLNQPFYNPDALAAIQSGYKNNGVLGAIEGLFNKTGQDINNVTSNFSSDATALYSNMLLGPLKDKTQNNLTKAGTLLSNTLVNFSETIDMATGANTVKNFVQGTANGGLKQGFSQALSATGLGSEQRKQVNADTGNFFVDLALEVAADPTTWVTLGTSAVFKSLGKRTVEDILIKSANDIGEDVSRESAQKLAKQITKYWQNTDSGLVESVAKVQSKKFLSGLDSAAQDALKNIPDTLKAQSLAEPLQRAVSAQKTKEMQFLTALKKNAQILENSNTYSLLEGAKLLRNVSDATQVAAAKASMLTSAAIFGYLPAIGVQALVKNRHAMSELIQTILNRSSKANEDGIGDIIDVVDRELSNDEYFDIVVKALGSDDDAVIKMGVAQATKDTVREFADDVNTILTSNKDTTIVLREVQDYVTEQTKGQFSSLPALLAKLKADVNIIHPDVLPLFNDMENRFNNLSNTASTKVVEASMDVLHNMNDVIGKIKYEGELSTDSITAVNNYLRLLSSLIDNSNNSILPVNSINASAIQLLIGQLKNLLKIDYTITPYVTQSGVDMTIKPTAVIALVQDSLTAAIKQMDQIYHNALLPADIKAGTLVEDMPVAKAASSVKLKVQATDLIKSLTDVQNAYNVAHPDKPVKTFITVPKKKRNAYDEMYSDFSTKHASGIREIQNGLDKLLTLLPDTEQNYYADILGEQVMDWTDNAITPTVITHAIDTLEQIAKNLTAGKSITGTIRSGRLNPEKLLDLTASIRDFNLIKLIGNYLTKVSLGTDTPTESDAVYILLVDKLGKAKADSVLQTNNVVETFVESTTETFLHQMLDTLYTMLTDVPAPSMLIDESLSASGVLYYPKLPHRTTFEMLLNIQPLQHVLNNVFNSELLGTLITLNMRGVIPEGLQDASVNLLTTAHDNYVTNKVLQYIDNTIKDDTARKALLDVLSGKQRIRANIVDPHKYTMSIVDEMKRYIDRTNNTAPPMLKELAEGPDTKIKAQRLYDIMSGKDDSYKAVVDKINESKGLYNDVIYVMAPINGSSFFEVTFIDGNGKTATFVNGNGYRLSSMPEQFAVRNYGIHGAEVLDKVGALQKLRMMDKGNVAIANNEAELAVMLSNYIKGINEETKTVQKQTRFIGFNNADDSNATDRILNMFLYKNYTSQTIGNVDILSDNAKAITVDVAQLYRAQHGAWVAPNTLVASLENLFTNVSKYLEATANSATSRGLLEYKPRMIVNITTDTLESIRAYYNMLNNYLGREASLSADTRRVLGSFDVSALVETRNLLADAIEGAADTLSSIAETNAEYSSILIVQKDLSRALGNPNVMGYIDSLDLGLKTMSNASVTQYWITTAYKQQHFVETAYNMARSFQNIYNRIGDHSVPIQFSKQLSEALSTLRNYMLNHADAYKLNVSMKQIIQDLRATGDANRNFVIVYWMYSKMQLIELPGGLLDPALVEVMDTADYRVFLNEAQHTPGIDELHSRYLKENDPTIQAAVDMQSIDLYCQQSGTLLEEINKKQAMLESSDVLTTAQKADATMLNVFFNFYNSIRSTYNKALYDYQDVVNKTSSAIDITGARHDYSDTIVKQIIVPKEELKMQHSINRVRTIMSMKADEYTAYLVKYADGIQVFDMTAKIYANLSRKAWYEFSTTLKQAETYGVRTFEDMENRKLYVYMDKNVITDEAMAEYLAYKPKVTPADTSNKAYNAFVDAMNIYTDNAYSLSMQSAFTVYQYRDLVNHLPAEVKNNMLEEEYLDIYDLLTGKLNSTLVGDYSYGAYKIFTNYSVDPYTNIASGFHSVYHKTHTRGMYMVMLNAPENKLAAYADRYSREEIRTSGLIACKILNNKLIKVPIDMPGVYKRALTDGTMLLDYASYTKAVEVLNDNTIHSGLYRALNKYWLVPDKISKLTSLGFIARNIPESIVKTLVQSGGDPEVLLRLPESHKKWLMYDRTSALLAKETQGFINRDAIDKFFIAHKTDVQVLSKDEYLNYKVFMDSSSSAPTAQQIQQKNDVVGNLYRTLSADDMLFISKEMVTDVVNATLSLKRDREAVKKYVYSKYTDEAIAKRLNTMQYLVPDWYNTPNGFDRMINKLYNNPIMKISSYVESVLRFHEYLYFTEYQAGSISEGLRAVDIGQSNRARDTKAQKLIETVFPFSSFALHNLIFWADTVNRRNSVIGLIEDTYSAYYDEDEWDIEEYLNNFSLMYALDNGNVILNKKTGLTFKLSDSLMSAFRYLTNPVDSFAGMFQGNVSAILRLMGIVNYNIPFYTPDDTGYSAALDQAKDTAILEAIPLFGVLYTRIQKMLSNYNTATTGNGAVDSWLTVLFPSMFSIVKLDSAGNTYATRPIGYDWYSQTDEYRKTHRYVFGISYVPAWLTKDPTKYIDTYGRLIDMGFTKEDAVSMMEDGWYISRKDLKLHNRSEYYTNQRKYTARKARKKYIRKPRKSYYRRVYTKKTYFKKGYIRQYRGNYYTKRISNSNRVYLNRRNKSMYPAAYRNVAYFGSRDLYKSMYAKYGATRMAMRIYAGANASAIKLARETIKSRLKQQYRRF